MPDNALTPAVVDVALGSLNALPPDHAGPTGRLVEVFDALVRHYSGDNGAKRVLLEPRESFSSLSDVLRNSQTGLVESGTWTSPTFLQPLGDQLLSIASNRPRVYNGADWTNYGDARVVTQKLSQSVLHATNNTIAAPSHAYVAGVTCSVWTEQSYDSDAELSTTLWVGFRADDGAWVRVPTQIPSDEDIKLAKVVQDGEHFWVFHNDVGGGPLLVVRVYDVHGEQLAATSVARYWEVAPGYWDVYGSFLAGVVLAQPAAYTAVPADVHVRVTTFTYDGTIHPDDLVIEDVHCGGPVAWLTNDLTGADQYLATVAPGEGGYSIWGYEISLPDIGETHEYSSGIGLSLLPDSITGWVEETGTPGERNAFFSYSLLAPGPASSGPSFDPATRLTKSFEVAFDGTVTVLRQTNSVIQQSRAFAINGEYHAYTYYASGSGQALPSAAEEVVITDGDYFIGPRIQPVRVSNNDYVEGAPFTLNRAADATTIYVSGQTQSGAVTGTDKVELISASGFFSSFGIPDGTPLLKWTFANLNVTSSLPGPGGGILRTSGTSIINDDFDIYNNTIGTGDVVYTPLISRNGQTVNPGTFTAAGTVAILSMTAYTLPDLTNTLFLEGGGSIVVSANANANNNGTFAIQRAIIGTRTTNLPTSGWNYLSFNWGTAIWVNTVSQAANGGTFTAVVHPIDDDGRWAFGQEIFTAADEGSFLQVTGAQETTNNNADGFEITTASGTTIDTSGADASATVAEIFKTPNLPTVSLRVPSTFHDYTLHIQSVTFDYRYIGALVSIAGAIHDTNDGVYKITDLVDANTVIVEPTNGRVDQRSEALDDDPAPSIFIQLATNVNQPTQPTWFVTPLTGTQPQVGCFEKGLAYADWRYDGETDVYAQNQYRFALSSTSNPFGTIRQVVLPFRASTFTQVSIATVGATPIDIANVAEASTVGLKVFRSQGQGAGAGDSGKLLVPGLVATEFTSSGFAESNFNVGPEAPFIVSQGEDTDTNFALTPGKTYTYQVVVARTLENGDVVRSLPSPAIQVQLTGDNNYVVLGGRTLRALDADGIPDPDVQGVTNHPNVTYEIYRSVVVDGVPSTQLHLVTNPANPNGLYSGSGTGSGFTFPDGFTWNYRDENPDAGIRATEPVYAGRLGQGIAPHFPAPAFSHACTWANRRWVVGYDGAVWMSAELVEGEDPWFFPGFRYAFPEEDPAVCVVGLENFLFIFCAKSVWRVPLAQFPNATLTAGSMPTPVRVPLAAGCSGFAVAMPDFVAYSSSVGDGRQVWGIDRNGSAFYLSEPLGTLNNPVSGMAVDGNQRLLVLAGDTNIRVYDPVPREWYVWRMPTVPTLVASYLGKPTYQDDSFVVKQTDSGFVDVYDEFETPVALDVTLADLSFSAVRSVKRLWEAQILGERNGACNINAVISYPDDAPTDPTTFGPEAVTNSPLLLAINPAIEDASTFQVRIFASYEDILTPGKCFALEMLSCEVGVDGRQGLRKLPNGFRLVGG